MLRGRGRSTCEQACCVPPLDKGLEDPAPATLSDASVHQRSQTCNLPKSGWVFPENSICFLISEYSSRIFALIACQPQCLVPPRLFPHVQGSLAGRGLQSRACQAGLDAQAPRGTCCSAAPRGRAFPGALCVGPSIHSRLKLNHSCLAVLGDQPCWAELSTMGDNVAGRPQVPLTVRDPSSGGSGMAL